MSEVKFSLSMTDQLSGPVKNAASAVEQLIGSSKRGGASLGMMGAQAEKLVGSSSGAASAIRQIDGEIASLVNKKINIEFDSARLVGQTNAAMASLKGLGLQIAGLTMRKVELEVGGGSSSELGKLEEQLAKLQSKKVNIEVDVAKSQATAELLKMSGTGIDSQIAGLNGKKSDIVNDVSLEEIDAGWGETANAIEKSAKAVQEFELSLAKAKLDKTRVEMESLGKEMVKLAEAEEKLKSNKFDALFASSNLIGKQRDAMHTSALSSLFGGGAGASSIAAQFAGITRIFGSDGAFNGNALFSKGINWIGQMFGSDAAGGAMKLAQGAAKADTALQGMGMSLGGVVATGAGAATGAIVAAAAAAVAAVGAVGALTYKFIEFGIQGAAAFTKFALASLSFRENTMVAFKTLTGSQKLADDVYGKAVKFAAATPFNTDTVVGAYQKLLVGGFKVDELETMMNAIGDTAAMKGMNPQVIEQMVAGFAKMKGLGKLTGEVLDMEAFQGISGKIKEELGAQLGKSSDEIAKMIGGGKIDATTAQKAILEVIRKTYSGGTLGGAMADFSKTWEGMWSNLTSRPSELFQAASLENGSGVQKMFDTLTKFGNVFVDALDPKSVSGKKITGLINSVGDTLEGVYGKGAELAKVFWKSMEGPTGDKILGTFREVGAAIKAAFGNIDGAGFGKWIDKWLPAIAAGLGGFAKGLARVFGMFSTDASNPEELAAAFGRVGEAVGTVVAMLVAASEVVISLVEFPVQVGVALKSVADVLKGIVGDLQKLLGMTNLQQESKGSWWGTLTNSLSGSPPSSPTAPTTSPTAVLPSGMDRNVQNILSMTAPSGGGNKTQNNTVSISVSGVGLDLSQLADLIKRGVTDAMLQVVPA